MTAPSTSRPPLDGERLARLLAGTPLRCEVSAADPSTNATASDRARAGETEGLVVATEHQTAGRGRLDRTWQTPDRAALTFSLLLRPDSVPVEHWPWLPLLTGYAVVQGLRTCEVDADLKWPNDVLLADRKLAGILLERVETPAGAAAVLGVGLNVSQAAGELPAGIATSLLLATGRAPDRTTLLAAVLRRLWTEYDVWRARGGDARGGLAPAYQRACVTVGRRVRVELPHAEPLVGTAAGIDAQGRLLVDGPGGRTAVSAGDVVHVRPGG